jgi:hypothetical protein
MSQQKRHRKSLNPYLGTTVQCHRLCAHARRQGRLLSKRGPGDRHDAKGNRRTAEEAGGGRLPLQRFPPGPAVGDHARDPRRSTEGRTTPAAPQALMDADRPMAARLLLAL